MSFNFLQSGKVVKKVENYNCPFMKIQQRTDMKFLILFPIETKQQK